MERESNHRMSLFIIILVLGTVAFSCSVAAEFTKKKAKDMKLDGSLCSIPRGPAFGLGVAAVVCLSAAQIAVTAVVCRARLGENNNKSMARRNKLVSFSFLILSWISFGLGAFLLAVGSSMNGGQAYGKGWMDGDCYVVSNGVFGGAAVLVVATVAFMSGSIFSMSAIVQGRTSPGSDERKRVLGFGSGNGR